MKFTDLKNWSKLTREEKERLKLVYGKLNITKTLFDKSNFEKKGVKNG